jgi:predicted acetyltransferase
MGATYRVDTAHPLKGEHSALELRHAQPEVFSAVRQTSTGSVKRPTSRPFSREVASATDHKAVHQFLVTVFQEPTETQFQHAINAPRYEPLDRMLMRLDDEIVAHVQLSHRTLFFGELALPTIDVRHLGTLPEYRQQGLATDLLCAIENETNLHGALILTVRARLPEYFQQQGWNEWLNYSFSSANPRALISRLEMLKPAAPTSYLESAPPELHVRLWRRNELDSIRQLYAGQTTERYGGTCRDEADWQWLISGGSSDRIYVAVRDSETEAYSPTTGEIVGYAVVRDSCVMELVVDESTDAARRLLVRVCADAMETGRHCVEYHAAPDCPLHQVFRSADGTHSTVNTHGGRQLLAKLLYPEQFLLKMRKTFSRRASRARLNCPRSLSVETESMRFRINLGRRQASIVYDDLHDNVVRMEQRHLNSLLLGQMNIERLIAMGLADVSDDHAFETALALFPALPTWRTPWEDLNAKTQ